MLHHLKNKMPHMFNVLQNSKKEQWQGSIAHFLFTSLEDDNSDESSESVSNALLFFDVGPDDSLVEPEEMDFGDDNDDTKNEGGQVAQLDKRWAKPIHLYFEALEGDCHPCHLCDQEIKECRKENNWPLWQNKHIYIYCVKWVIRQREKRNMAALTPKFNIKCVLEHRETESGICIFFFFH